MPDDSNFEELTYVGKEPNVTSLRYAYDQTVVDLGDYFDLCRTSYDDRRNWWPGKSSDLRKHGADAFPWEGAADMESHVIDERVTKLVSLFISSLNRANVRAFPVEFGDIAQAKVVSNFLKWMTSSGYIPRFSREMELGANYLLERGILITYVGWHREDRRFIQKLDLDQIAQISPELAELILSEVDDEEVVELLKATFDGVTTKKAKRALKELRKTGAAELPVVRRQVDAPEVKTLAPDGDFMFPSYVTDPQRSPYCFWRTYYTAQELENKVVTDDWDEDFVQYVIDKYRGVNIDSIERSQEAQRSSTLQNSSYESNDLIELVHVYQRLVDPEDSAEGIYETIIHKDFDGDAGLGIPAYAKHELMNGYEDYPVVVTKLSEDSKRLYDCQTIPATLRGMQQQVKIERDSRVDRNSLATLPPIMHPVGNSPKDWGPGRMVPYRRKGEIEFGPTPALNSGSNEMEDTLERQSNALVGLDFEDPISQMRRQFLVDKFLKHSAEVMNLAYRCYQRFGPDEIFFRVTGSPDPQQYTKGTADENFDIVISYDVLNSDPDAQEKKLNQLTALTQLDRNGRISVDKLLEVAANSIDPILADTVLQPAEEAQEQIVKQVTGDLTHIFSGIEMPARPNGAQIALQVIQEYTQQPDIAARLQADQSFAARLQKYAGQYQFQMQQAENAQIGRVGTTPAAMGSIDTQNI